MFFNLVKVFKICLNNIYFLNFDDSFNNIYHFFIISVIIASELLIFISLFSITWYYSCNLSLGITFLDYINSFNIDFLEFPIYYISLITLLCTILVTINFFFYFLQGCYYYNFSVNVYNDCLVCMVLLSFFFITIQYYEFIFCSLCFFDSIVSLCFFSLVSLHCAHVCFGCLFLCILFFSVNRQINNFYV